MTNFNLTHATLSKLRGIKLPNVDRKKVTKFFYEYFLGLSDHEMSSLQKRDEKIMR